MVFKRPFHETSRPEERRTAASRLVDELKAAEDYDGRSQVVVRAMRLLSSTEEIQEFAAGYVRLVKALPIVPGRSASPLMLVDYAANDLSMCIRVNARAAFGTPDSSTAKERLGQWKVAAETARQIEEYLLDHETFSGVTIQDFRTLAILKIGREEKAAKEQP